VAGLPNPHMASVAATLPSRYGRPQQVAVGGMGEIYLAEDRTLGRKVAIKLLAERFARDEAIRRRFTREALAAARLSGHPHIVTIFDVGEADGRPFIVMEYLSGGTLADRSRRGPVSRDQAVEWLEQAADALDSAHENGIVHRDVKPANMLLDERAVVHVGDFGIARVVDETTTGMTLAGTVLGTAGYLSPEQARGEPATPASDVYSLGIVAYELLTGGRPFEGGSATAEAAAHIHQPVPPASERGVGLPGEVDAVFERALAKDPQHRYRTARDFVRALCLALETRDQTKPLPVQPGGVPPDRVAAPLPAYTRKRRPWLPVLAVLAIAAAAIAGVVLAATLGGDGGGQAADRTTEPRASTIEVTVTETGPQTTVERVTTVEAPPPAPPPTAPTAPPPASAATSISAARSLNNQAFALMQQGRYAEALPLAQRALARLEGSGVIDEAYANYNVGRSLIELGRCDEGLPYIDRSQALQGTRSEFATARAKCA
jgi:eukaryotic-like serine/threonine-protein kinase